MRIIYEGRANCYSINWKGKQLKLLPLNQGTTRIVKPEATQCIIVNENKLLATYKEAKCLMELVLREDRLQIMANSKEIQTVLSDFEYIYSNEIPFGLPLIRNI